MTRIAGSEAGRLARARRRVLNALVDYRQRHSKPATELLVNTRDYLLLKSEGDIDAKDKLRGYGITIRMGGDV